MEQDLKHEYNDYLNILSPYYVTDAHKREKQKIMERELST